MICLQQVKIKLPVSEQEIKNKICGTLRIAPTEILSYQILKRSLDARKKPELFYVYQLALELVPKTEQRLRKKLSKAKNISFSYQPKTYSISNTGSIVLQHRPVVVGMGPAGLFCAYELAKLGFRPLVLERGKAVEARQKDVEHFWKTGVLDPSSNVQFGEGGAGTFSDGKLNTLIKDSMGRGHEVLNLFVQMGAPEQILYDQKPHIGTDLLIKVVRNIREEIIRMGGEVRFSSQVIDIQLNETSDGQHILTALKVKDLENNKDYQLPAEVAVFAIGHSARDTFEVFHAKQISMEQKAFAVGVRVEHSQEMINLSQYGTDYKMLKLPAAAYKLTTQSSTEHGVYTFCMCPGGYVVNASSEDGLLAVNGMSYADRGGKNANTAVIVTIRPEDYASESDHVLAGVKFQRELEKKAFDVGSGKIPVQLYGDYLANRISTAFGTITPQMRGAYSFGNVRSIFPPVIGDAIAEGIRNFGKKIPGYDHPDTLISGVESRTSSPIRIIRDGKSLESMNTKGLYPCGEGAGYAGGITSAAIDGMKVAEAIASVYKS